MAFAATMVRYSNYSYEPSLGQRVSAGKALIEDYPVGQEISSKLWEMLSDAQWFAQRVMPGTRSEVINQSFFDGANQMEPGSVDLIITSPPYLNNYHYNRNTRPQMYWLGFAHRPADFRLLEQQNVGKYWQTVREKKTISLAFHLPNSDLEAQIAHLRSLRADKGIYGGHGWANYAASYFNDCQRFAQSVNFVLKPGGRALVVIGNSILQGVLISTDQYLAQIAELEGLELVRIDIPRATRVGNSIIQSDVRAEKASKKAQLYEAVVELRKP
ncbi:MAG: site-specific DNA-methyltransferase [Ardenticatenales bacterium]|nr:site-specific DNA-methyltransferase [Ardenticatenales bacterium]